jgi:hypothetical protein
MASQVTGRPRGRVVGGRLVAGLGYRVTDDGVVNTLVLVGVTRGVHTDISTDASDRGRFPSAAHRVAEIVARVTATEQPQLELYLITIKRA